MKKENPARTAYTLSHGKLVFVAVLLLIPMALFLIFPFLLLWGPKTLQAGIYALLEPRPLLILLFGIIVHELLHGFTWALFTQKGLRSIRFGINLNYMAPYTHCKEPLKAWQFFTGASMPLIILGLGPSLYGIISGNGTVFFFGILFIWGASGDIVSLFMLRKISKNTLVHDHPNELGFYVEQRKARK
ncbi:MAG: DUF3267 domain-containing protein [Bacteroidales bacterium]|nr:DUF3267 domain-containing protein [Bacteroidales bacterium]